MSRDPQQFPLFLIVFAREARSWHRTCIWDSSPLDWRIPCECMWYDVNRWVGLHTGLNYLYDRPKATTTAGGISTSETWNIDRVTLSTGFVVGVS